MFIQEKSREECLQVLAGTRLVRLGCAHENQPYIVPVYMVYHQLSGGEVGLYGFTTPGQKVEWMRANPLVCVEIDHISGHDEWVSVVALGHYEELPESPGHDEKRLRDEERPQLVGEAPRIGQDLLGSKGCEDERFHAWQVVKSHPGWEEPGYTSWASSARHDPSKPFVSVFYRVRIDQVSGREATRESRYVVPSAGSSTPNTTRGS